MPERAREARVPPDPDVRSAHDLYALAPDEFVAARNRLAKALRAAGSRDEAKRVAELRRPSRSAWALNQVARTQPDVIDRALRAARDLAAAMVAAMNADSAQDGHARHARHALRDAQASERAALDAVWDAAATELASHGDHVARNDPLRQRVTDTVRAAAADDVLAAGLRAGELASDHEAPAFGFGALAALAGTAPMSAATTAPTGSKPPADTARRKDGADHRDHIARDARERAQREQARREQERRDRAQREQRAEVARLENEADRLAAVATDAAAAATRAQQDADKAAAELADARARLDALLHG